MNDFFGTLKTKFGPFPVWVWAGLGTVLLALFLIHRKNASASNTTSAAADQANSNLGSAAELANMFEVAGLMPYQGGDVYVNTTTTTAPPPASGTPTPVGGGTKGGGTTGGSKGSSAPPKPTATYRVKKGDTLTSIAKKYGVSEANLWAYNTTKGVRPASTISLLKSRGQNLLFSNEEILIPPKNWKPS